MDIRNPTRWTMETIDDVKIDYDDDVHFRIRRTTQQVGPDEIKVDVYQESGAERHRWSRFRVEDEENFEAYHVKSSSDDQQPWQMALVGLQEYGWDCTNAEIQRGRGQAEEGLFTALDGIQSTFEGLYLVGLDDGLYDDLVFFTYILATILRDLKAFEREHGYKFHGDDHPVDAASEFGIGVVPKTEMHAELAGALARKFIGGHIPDNQQIDLDMLLDGDELSDEELADLFDQSDIDHNVDL